MIYWPAVVSGLVRRRWAAQLARSAPDRLTVAAAAKLLGVDQERFLGFLRSRLELPVSLQSELRREDLVRRLGSSS